MLISWRVVSFLERYHSQGLSLHFGWGFSNGGRGQARASEEGKQPRTPGKRSCRVPPLPLGAGFPLVRGSLVDDLDDNDEDVDFCS